MKIYKLGNNLFTITEKNYNAVNNCMSDGSSNYFGIKELFKHWRHKKLDLSELELGLLDAELRNNNVIEFGDIKGKYIYSYKGDNNE